MTPWLPNLMRLHTAKDQAYGDAWCRRGEVLGIFPNIARKYDRWARIRLESDSASAVVEPLDDTLADLLIYAVKYVVWLIERHPEAASGLPGQPNPRLDVNEGLTLVAELPLIDVPEDAAVEAFEQLEQSLTDGNPPESHRSERAVTAFSLARAAWTLLQALPVTDELAVPNLTVASSSSPARNSLRSALLEQLLAGYTQQPGTILLLGYTPTAIELRSELTRLGLGTDFVGIFDPDMTADAAIQVRDWREAGHLQANYLVVASDENKERLLRRYAQANPSATCEVIVSGTAHLAFRDPLFDELDAPALVPSYATGYANTRVHMFQYLQAAAANGLSGAIVELGAFKGGTTAWLARVAKRLNLDANVLAFDSWEGFPPRRSLLDMYTHPRCVFSDLAAVCSYLEPLGVEVVVGDITETAPRRLKDLPVLLAFIDTDNYSPAAAALATIVENVVPGGAIMFDHYTTTEEYIYTLGERMAANSALPNRGFLQLHGTGMFLRLSRNP